MRIIVNVCSSFVQKAAFDNRQLGNLLVNSLMVWFCVIIDLNNSFKIPCPLTKSKEITFVLLTALVLNLQLLGCGLFHLLLLHFSFQKIILATGRIVTNLDRHSFESSATTKASLTKLQPFTS